MKKDQVADKISFVRQMYPSSPALCHRNPKGQEGKDSKKICPDWSGILFTTQLQRKDQLALDVLEQQLGLDLELFLLKLDSQKGHLPIAAVESCQGWNFLEKRDRVAAESL